MEIVALKNFVPDDVNKLIFKFIGFRSKVAEEFQKYLKIRPQRALFPSHVFFRFKFEARIKYIYGVRRNLAKIKEVEQRKEEFIKLPKCVRRELFIHGWRGSFPKNKTNLKFLNDQLEELKFKERLRSWAYQSLTW